MSAAYKHIVNGQMDLPDLLDRAEDVREAAQTPGWKLIAETIEMQRNLMLQRLTNPSTKPEDVRYLQGLVAGLASMREAAETIVAYAGEREAEARNSLQEQIA